MKVLERASIKYKLWLPPIICLFGLLLLKVYTISRFRAELIERNIATIETTIFHHADEIRDSISQYVKDVNFLANTPPVEPFYEASISNDIDAYQKWRQRIIIILKSFMESRGEYLQISLLDRDGKEIISITSDFILGISIVPKKDLQDEKDMPYFLEAINAGNGQHYISDIILNKVLDKNNSYQRTVIQVAIPVYIPSSSKSSGVIAVSLDSRKTFGHLNQKSEPTTLYLLNSKRQYINRSDDEQRDYKDIREGDFQFIDNSNLKKLVQTDERSIGFYPEDKKVTGFEKIHFDEFRPERYWILYGAISEAIIFSRVNDLTALSFVLGLLITVFMSVLLFRASSLLTARKLFNYPQFF